MAKSEYGIKIKNFQAGSIYGYNLGIRDNYETTDAMLVNSLFSEFIVCNGLNVWKEESTRDIVCIEFDYGTRSFQDEVGHLNSLIKDIEQNKGKASQMSEQEKNELLEKYNQLKERAISNMELFDKKSPEQIREIFYVNGVDIEYLTHNKKGDIISRNKIHYKMLYRTPGKAKKGTCMFINETLYDIARNFLYMGLKLPYENAPIVEVGAYSSLITSSIVGKIQIKPNEILILNDVDSFFTTSVVSVETDENKHCIARHIDGYKLKNTLFDGQALIDESIFPDWADGYVLLRHHFTKMAAFNSNIQSFFKDYFGDNYETATVKDMFGNNVLVKDIKLITTDNAIKWRKFDVSFEYWCDRIKENDYMFGIVKTAHKSKLGEVQQMSYQMVNSLDIKTLDDVCACSLDYIYKLKSDNKTFIEYLERNKNFSNDYEPLIALYNQNSDFANSDYFRQRRRNIISKYIVKFKTGKIIQNADNLVIVGSPYAMLLHSVGEDVEKDDTFAVENGVIQCYTERFADGECLAEFRSPFNSRNNLGYLHNVYSDKMKKYFNFGEQIIAVNMIHTDFQSRNNGSDMDSDSIYVTNQPQIVEFSKYCYLNYPTIENNIPMEKNKYTNTLLNYAKIDNSLAEAQLAIGESSNLAFISSVYSYTFDNPEYDDIVCILAVVAQAAIDNAKRKFDININEEIKRIKKQMNIKENGYPIFWKLIHPTFNEDRINYRLKCPMNYIYDISIPKYKSKENIIPMNEFFNNTTTSTVNRRKSKKVEMLIEKYSIDLYDYNVGEDKNFIEYLMLKNKFEELIEDIRTTYISSNYKDLMVWLLNRGLMITTSIQSKKKSIITNLNKNRSLLFKVLYELNPTLFLECFNKKPSDLHEKTEENCTIKKKKMQKIK